MKLWRTISSRFIRREQREDELAKEISAHLDLEAEERAESGISTKDARYEAFRAFGNAEIVKEDVRKAWGGLWLEELLRDLRFGFRTFRSSPGFAIVAVLSLALGIGGNAAMFSMVNNVLLRPLPYTQPEKLVRVTGFYPKGAVAAMQQLSATMEVAGVTSGEEFNLAGRGDTLRIPGCSVSANFFTLLGVEPQIGEVFRSGQDQPGSDQLVILSHAIWEKKFASDPTIIGRMLTIDGKGRQVIGVMPATFRFPSADTDLWIPLHMDSRDSEDYWGKGFMPAIGRLRGTATVAQARGELHPLIARIIPMFSFPMGRNWNVDSTVEPLQKNLTGDVRSKLLLLLCAVSLVLLIACVNVAGLLLARATSRRKEIGLRVALGAARGRLIRQFLAESIGLALTGAVVGLALAYGGLAVLKSAIPLDIPGLREPAIDLPVLVFMAVLAMLTGLLAGIAPALHCTKLDVVDLVKSGGQRSTGVSGVRLRGLLISGEVALAVVLAVGAGLLVKSLWRMVQVNPGFSPERMLTVRVSHMKSDCKVRATCITFYEELLRRARAISGVSEAATVNTVPLYGQMPAVPAEIEGHPLVASDATAPLLWAGGISSNYFRVMRIPLIAGREFAESDAEKSAKVIIVSAATAQKYWPGENPIGKHIRVVWDNDWRTVVGVVGDVKEYSLVSNIPDFLSGEIYMPYPQSVDLSEQIPATMQLIVRMDSEGNNLVRDVRSIVMELDPSVPVGEVRTLDSIITNSTAEPKSLMWLFVTFAGCALVLAAIGTYGVVSYSAAQRTYEMGVRVALGASRSAVFGLVIGQSFRLVIAGLAVGVATSLAATRILAGFLYDVSPTDPVTLVGVAALLIGIAVVAGFVPARRAARIDPVTALRVE
jgi:putative ABC transport system permease protein